VRLLIVDDQAAFRQAARDLLENRGNVVAEAEDGSGALAEVARFDPDAVLLDIRLGKESGYDVARALIRAWPELPVVLISIDDSGVSPRSVRDCGARGFINKRRLATADLVALIRGESS
jgi:DNA-binding NarL/FixJ family response regulator